MLDAFPADGSAAPTTVADTAAPSTATPSTAAPTTAAEPVPISWVDELAGRVGDGAVVIAPPATDVVADDTGRLDVQVPQEWADRSTAGDGQAPYVAASPDLPAFLDGYDAPGLAVTVLEGPSADALAAYSFDGACTDGGRHPYADVDVEGEYHVWHDCGGTATDIVTMTVARRGDEVTAVLLAQLLTSADVATLDTAFHSLRF